MSDRIPQRGDDIHLRLVLSGTTEEWAEELLLGDDERYEVADTAERTDEGLVLTRRIGGNCNAIQVARGWLDEIEDALREGEIDPMGFTLVATPGLPVKEGDDRP